MIHNFLSVDLLIRRILQQNKQQTTYMVNDWNLNPSISSDRSYNGQLARWWQYARVWVGDGGEHMASTPVFHTWLSICSPTTWWWSRIRIMICKINVYSIFRSAHPSFPFQCAGQHLNLIYNLFIFFHPSPPTTPCFYAFLMSFVHIIFFCFSACIYRNKMNICCFLCITNDVKLP